MATHRVWQLRAKSSEKLLVDKSLWCAAVILVAHRFTLKIDYSLKLSTDYRL